MGHELARVAKGRAVEQACDALNKAATRGVLCDDGANVALLTSNDAAGWPVWRREDNVGPGGRPTKKTPHTGRRGRRVGRRG